jgi:hypothetical protein
VSDISDADMEILWQQAIEHAANIETARLTWAAAKAWLARRKLETDKGQTT